MTATRDAREGVLAHIAHSPGCHLRELERALAMPLGTLRYHLERLERERHVRVEYDRRFKRYYAHDVEDRLARTLSAIRPVRPRRVVVHLIEHPDQRHAELTRALAIAPSTLSSYLDRLAQAGVVEAKDGRFHVLPAARVVQALAQLQRGFLDRLVEDAMAVFDETERG